MPLRRPVDLQRIIADQERIFKQRQPGSAGLAERARRALAGGVTSSWQITAPQPVWLSHGRGSKVYDVDGNEYVDLHGGYGAALAGHGHPAIVEAVRGQVARGTHFAQPTEDALVVAGELARRFGLPLWRFANSGTEATMDAVHLMRAITGRDLIIKVEGCYHGHHDSVQVSVTPEPDEVGPAGKPGLTGVVPDIICLAKAIGGGIAVAAIGGSEQVMEHVTNGDYEMVGTFNGNPLAMAAARAMLCEVATAQAYERIERLRARAVAGLELEIARAGLAAHVVSAGAKGCVVISPQPVRDYRGFLDVDDRYSQATWLFQHNGGVFLPPWGKIEQWLISVQHDESDIDLLIANFADFAQTIS